MPDFNTVVDSLIFGKPMDPSPAGRTAHRLGEGVYHLDYHDDHVYVVTVEQVPRVQLQVPRPARVGEIDGVGVELVRVSYADHVEVVLDGEPGPARDAGLDGFRAAWRRWERRANREPPPPWPGDRLTDIAVRVVDDAGTGYRRAWGESGGTGTEYRCASAFLPAPPAQARTLTLTFTSGQATPVTIDFPLTPPAAS